MELSESVESINRQLRDQFGISTESSEPIFRIVFSDHQKEKRLVDTTDKGIVLLQPEVREVPKYQWIRARFVLEQLVLVPDPNIKELPTSHVSYEPLWIFETQKGVYLPPRFDAAKLIIDTMYAALGKSGLKKYVDPKEGQTLDERKEEVEVIVKELFGNETETGDALAYGEGVSVPSNYEKVN